MVRHHHVRKGGVVEHNRPGWPMALDRRRGRHRIECRAAVRPVVPRVGAALGRTLDALSRRARQVV
eukprot:SAG31_NODE_237_length_19590_cov_13.149915_7_plen_66_part_00